MKAKQAIVLGLLGVAVVGGLSVAAIAVQNSKTKYTKASTATNPNVNPNVNPNLPSVDVQTGTGYRDVTYQQVDVTGDHLDGFWQYEGGYR